MTTPANSPSKDQGDLAGKYQELAEKFNMPDLADPEKAADKFGDVLRGMNEAQRKAAALEAETEDLRPFLDRLNEDEDFRSKFQKAMDEAFGDDPKKTPLPTTDPETSRLKQTVSTIEQRLQDADFNEAMSALEEKHGIRIDDVKRSQIREQMRSVGVNDPALVASKLLLDDIVAAHEENAAARRRERDGRSLPNDSHSASASHREALRERLESAKNEDERREIRKQEYLERTSGRGLW